MKFDIPGIHVYMRDCAPVNVQINAKGDATVPGGGLLLVRRG